jgi:aspartate aminotransferase|tara:strand:+ start:926 stop:2125 length:1200 start_codon:yes stop_codon:yes gene_type:complete
MPSISKKGNLMPESPIRKLVPYAEKAKAKGVKVYHLNIGQPDIETPVDAINAVKKSDIKVLAYSKSEGDLVLREKISKYYKSHNVEITTSEIIVTSGASEALLFTIGSIMDPDDEVIIPEPFYANYNGFSIANGVKIVPIFSSIENNFSLPNIDKFESLISDKTKAILICNPNNPTGYVYSKEEIKRLVEIVKKHNLYLIADEVYREFTYDGILHTSIMEFEDISQNAVVIDSVSKRYSMCGARIGCIISKNKEFMATAMKFAQARLSPPSLAQIASTAAMDTGQDYFDNIIKEYNQRRVILIEGLKNIPGVKVSEPNGAFYCVAQLPIENAEDFAKWLLERYHLNNETIMIAPANGFYSTPNTGNNQVRIAYVLNENDLKSSIEILKNGLNEYQKNGY